MKAKYRMIQMKRATQRKRAVRNNFDISSPEDLEDLIHPKNLHTCPYRRAAKSLEMLLKRLSTFHILHRGASPLRKALRSLYTSRDENGESGIPGHITLRGLFYCIPF